jgi:hypothetical protein
MLNHGIITCIVGKCLLVGNHLLLRNFGHYGIIFMNTRFVTVAVVMMLRDLGLYRIIFRALCFTALDFLSFMGNLLPVHII